MTKLLEQAFAQASRLPEDQQEAIAALLLEEIASEQRWSAAFAQSQEELSALADEAIKEFEDGKTRAFETDADLTND